MVLNRTNSNRRVKCIYVGSNCKNYDLQKYSGTIGFVHEYVYMETFLDVVLLALQKCSLCNSIFSNATSFLYLELNEIYNTPTDLHVYLVFSSHSKFVNSVLGTHSCSESHLQWHGAFAYLVISEEPRHSHLLPSFLPFSCHWMFKKTTKGPFALVISWVSETIYWLLFERTYIYKSTGTSKDK